jgi:hypothetical protein
MSRRRHEKAEVEDVLRELEAMGWRIKLRKGGGHAWALALCPWNDRECRGGMYCQMTVNSTPQNPGNHAARLLNQARNCIRWRDREEADGKKV